jgi:glycosyltransferase involved in cell wall biosynthesis
MRILLVSSGSGSRGGGEIFLDYLGHGLADRGHEVLMWIPAHPRMDELARRCARFARVIRGEYRNTYDYWSRSLSTCWNWGVSRRVAREWGALAPDVIHLNKQNLEDGLDLLRAVRHCGVPSVCTIHLTQTARYLRVKAPRLRDWISRSALVRYCGVIVAVQEARRKELNDLLGGRVRTRTVFNGVPIASDSALGHLRKAKRAELGLRDGDFLVLGLGRLVEQKRPFRFLETARELHRKFSDTRFLWVGDGELSAQWAKWVRREGLDSVISCAGWQRETLPFLLAADLLLHVAEFEGLPFAILEAMAAGLPCAVTRGFAVEIPMFDDETVLSFDDPAALADSLRDRAALRRVAAGARRLVQTRLSLRSMTESYEQVYREVAGA